MVNKLTQRLFASLMPSGGTLEIETENVNLDETYTREHPPTEPGRYVMIAVTDTGVGIDKATLPRIFDPFFTTKEIGKGTGQGLAIARSVVVDKHKGSIHFETEVEKGTTFIIRLPHDGKVPAAKAVSA